MSVFEAGMRLKKSFKLKKIKTPRAAAPVRVKEFSPPSFRTSGAATAVMENNRRELFHPRRRAVSCEAALRILSNGE